MNPKQTARLRRFLLMLAAIGLALGSILYALSENIDLFYTPSDLKTASISPAQRLRVGGMVVPDSVKRSEALKVSFQITDLSASLTISYVGILPDLFKEGSGIVADGHLQADGTFLASQVLAKHDENYMPPQLSSALKKIGNTSE